MYCKVAHSFLSAVCISSRELVKIKVSILEGVWLLFDMKLFGKVQLCETKMSHLLFPGVAEIFGLSRL